MLLRFALALALTASVFSLDASAQQRGRGFGYSGITVYEHPDFRGESVTFRNEVIRGPGGAQTVFDDPSGNPVEIFQPA